MAADYKSPLQRWEVYWLLKQFNDCGIHPVVVLYLSALQSSSIPIYCGAVFILWDGSRLVRLTTSELRSSGFEKRDSYFHTIESNWIFFCEQQNQTNTPEDGSVPPFTVSKNVSDGCFEVTYASNTKCTILGGQDLMRVNCKESKLKFFIKHIILLLKLLFFLLWEILYSVGKEAGSVTGFLKLFGIGFGIDIPKLFKICKLIDPTDYVKVISNGGITVLLCYIGMSKRPSPFAYRLSGVAVLSAVVHIFWTIFSPLPRSYSLWAVFACVSLVLHATACEAFSKITL